MIIILDIFCCRKKISEGKAIGINKFITRHVYIGKEIYISIRTYDLICWTFTYRHDWHDLFCLSQAFLEMADENAAATMVTYYASGIAQLRGRAVYVQFSNHRELKTDQTHSNNAVSSPTNDVANTSEVCVILLASLLSRFTNFGGRGLGAAAWKLRSLD